MTSRTILAVHAHPDDECILTGGALARYSDEGHRTVLVTCTDGAVGEIHAETGGRPLADVRAEELAAACKVLGVGRQLFLGYRDSGMAGTDDNDHPDCLAAAPLDGVADRLLAVFEEERPDVVVTYDEGGGYGHPDHVRAHQATVAAWVRSQGEAWAPRKLYFASFPRSGVKALMEQLREAGITPPNAGEPDESGEPDVFLEDDRFTTTLDVSGVFDRKRAALRCHATQVPEDSWFVLIPDEIARIAFGSEFYVLADSRVDTSTPETDLLAGL